MNEIDEKRWKQFDELGDKKVRQNLATYGEDRSKLAREWLAIDADRKMESSMAEQLSIARDAKDAAVSAATTAAEALSAARDAASAAQDSAATARLQLKTAQAANTRATIALVVAAVAAIASVIIPFIRPS